MAFPLVQIKLLYIQFIISISEDVIMYLHDTENKQLWKFSRSEMCKGKHTGANDNSNWCRNPTVKVVNEKICTTINSQNMLKQPS